MVVLVVVGLVMRVGRDEVCCFLCWVCGEIFKLFPKVILLWVVCERKQIEGKENINNNKIMNTYLDRFKADIFLSCLSFSLPLIV